MQRVIAIPPFRSSVTILHGCPATRSLRELPGSGEARRASCRPASSVRGLGSAIKDEIRSMSDEDLDRELAAYTQGAADGAGMKGSREDGET